MEIDYLHFSEDLDMSLRDAVALTEKDQIFMLADSNTKKSCVPLVQSTLGLPEEHILVIEPGDSHKTLETVETIWHFLLDRGATRSSLLINVGGGMVMDIGGFAASTFMRGIDFVNIPTSLLAAVDASYGGKIGFNYAGLKNSIGFFSEAKDVIISSCFLDTLPKQELLSGYAEMLKHALISSPLELNRILAFNLDRLDKEELMALVKRSVVIKHYIVEQDPTETGLRKTLNFGHTIGHALEEMSLKEAKGQADKAMPHGYAVFYGLLAEMYLSVKRLGFDKTVVERCLPLLYEYYGKPQCSCREQSELIKLMQHDKKNTTTGEINFTLLRSVGNAYINQVCTNDEINEALDYLFSL